MMAFETTFSELTSQRAVADGAGRGARHLLGLVDAALAGCIFVVPMLLGGRHAFGHFALALLATTAAAAWWCRQCLLPQPYWRRSLGNLLLLAAIALVGLQIVPLPPGWIARLSPKTIELLPLWGQAGSWSGLGVWERISLTPAASQTGLVLLLSYAMLFWVAVQRIRCLDDVEQLLRWTAFSAMLMAAFGIIQYLTSNGKFFWVYEHPFAGTSDGVKGAFTNRNHFAHFLALGLGPLIWWVQDGLRLRGRREEHGFRTSTATQQVRELGVGIRVLGLGLVLFAILMSLSRGGAVVAGLAVAVSITICYRAGTVRGRFAASLAVVAVLLGASLAIVGHDRVTERLEGLTSGSLEQIDQGHGRRKIWKTTLAAIPDFRWAGAGIGSFREVYPIYLEHLDGLAFYTHAENGYLQVTLEAGLAGLVLTILVVLLCAFWSGFGLLRATSRRMSVAAGAAASALLVSAVHSTVDFVWYAPGCMVIVSVMAGCACRLRQFVRDEEARRGDRFALPRTAPWFSAAAVAGVGAWMVASQFGPLGAEQHWHRYQRLNRAAYLRQPVAAAPVEEQSPLDETGRAAAEVGRLAAEIEAERRMVTELLETVRWNPQHARAHLALAASYLRLFHHAQETAINRMPLSQIRDAAIAADYTSREELNEWLRRSVGEHCIYLDRALEHTQQSLGLSPLLGEGYLYLGELGFLAGTRDAAKSAFVEQALRVRPHDGTVLFHAGREAWLAGRFDEGLAFWKRSFQAGPLYQNQVIEWLAGRTIPSALEQEIAFFLEEFQPDLDGLQSLYRRYRQIAAPEQLAPLLAVHAERASQQALEDTRRGLREQAAERWLQAMASLIDLGDTARAAVCAEKALECNPNHFHARYKAGCLLADLGRLGEAEEHLTWCIRRKPDYVKARRRLAEVKRQIFDPHGLSVVGGPISYPPGATSYQEARLHVPGASTLPAMPAPHAQSGPPTSIYRR